MVRKIRAQAASGPRHRAVIQGIGDDCAVVRPDANTDLVYTTDLVVEGRHFTRDQKPSDVGHRALARSLSDLAAMGAEPVFCLVSLAVPADCAGTWTERFYQGLLRLAQRHRIQLAGGDLSRADQIVADVMCCGSVPRGRALLRSTARPGDRVYVTGPLGKPWAKNLRPEPRIAEGLALRGIATAAMDLSDGISLDLHRLCVESNVSADLRSAAIPLARGSNLEQALHGGEDYEILFTARRNLPGGPVPIGEITKGATGQVRLDGNILQAKGWDHFR